MFRTILAISLLLFSFCAAAQSSWPVKGIIRDCSERPIAGVTIRLSNSDTLWSSTDTYGSYYFNNVKAGTYLLAAIYHDSTLYLGSYNIRMEGDTTIIQPIVINLHSKSLEEVIVRPPPVLIKEDTIQYNAAAYRFRDNAVVEDLIKKFPGLMVDKDGNITAQGKPVVKVLVNGKDFFAGDVLTATQNLPADIVRNIQIIDDYGDQANMTGIKTGEPQKVININIRKDKSKGTFGDIVSGVGTKERYLANLSLNHFKDGQQLSLVGTANNTNLNANVLDNSSKDNSLNLPVSNIGDTKTYKLGINYRSNWGKKLIVYGSYNFSARGNYREGTMYQQDLNPFDTRITNRSSANTSEGNSHRLNWNIEYVVSPKSSFKLSTNASFADVQTTTRSTSTINRMRFFTENRYSSDAVSDNSSITANVFFNHRFAKRGRNLNINVIASYGSPIQRNWISNLLTDVDSAGGDSLYLVPLSITKEQNQHQDNNNHNLNTRLNLSFTEPISERIIAELSYSLSYEDDASKRNLYNFDSVRGYELNLLQANDYQFIFLTNRYSFNIQSRQKKYNYLVGIMAQSANLYGFNHLYSQQAHYANTSWVPIARLMYRFTAHKTITLNYNGSYRMPDFQKLQPVIDSTNPSSIIIGNPNLKPEFTNQISAAYNTSNMESGTVLFANLSYARTLNRIVNKVHNDPYSTSLTTSYVNDNGSYYLLGHATISQMFNDHKYIVMIGLGSSFYDNAFYTDYERSISQNWTVQPNVKLLINLPDRLDAELGAGYVINQTSIKYPSGTLNSETRSFTFNLSGKMHLYKGLNFGYDYSRTLDLGYYGEANANTDMLFLSIEYRFLNKKQATICLQGFDLLNRDTRLTRVISGTTIADNRNNGLGQYCLLSFAWKLNAFSKDDIQ